MKLRSGTRPVRTRPSKVLCIVSGLLISWLACGSIALADPIQINVSGEIDDDSSVQNGTPYQLTIDFDNSQSSSDGVGSSYGDDGYVYGLYNPVGSWNLTFGDYDLAGTGTVTVFVLSNSPGPTGYQFEMGGNGYGYTITNDEAGLTVAGDTPIVPNYDLDSVFTIPLSGPFDSTSLGEEGGGAEWQANVTSFTVSGATAPPPVTPVSSTTPVSTGTSYSTVAPVTSNGGLGTTIALVGGQASSNQSVTLSSTNGGAYFKSMASDVMSVSGNAGSVFAVQLTFNLQAANFLGGASNMAVLWLDPKNGFWENAAFGDLGPNTDNTNYENFQGSFSLFESEYGANDSNLSNFLGAYGVDTTNDTVWAVIDHNSEFGVGSPSDLPQAIATPEPSTWALLLGGGIVLALLPRRRTKTTGELKQLFQR